MTRIVVIGGPTASGKSALAVRLAQDDNGVVINADSMQLYDALPLLTARPGADDMAMAPHRLYAVLRPDQKSSAQSWREMAIAEIEHTIAAGKTPVVVGGSGLYIKALMDGFSPIPPIDPAIRERLNAVQADIGNPAFHAMLSAHDPVMAHRLNPNDTQRLIRAMEVFEGTGKSLAYWQDQPPSGPPAGWAFDVHILKPDRDILRQRCDQRFDQMMEMGALDEVRAAMDHIPDDALVSHALGYRRLRDYVRGEIDLEQAVTLAKIETRQYAKRQDTWFRNQI